MSIRVMQAVWEHSAQSGGALVLLLAIADNAHDDGDGAYPAIETLAKKARMTGRNVNILLKQLVAAGEIAIRHNAGPNGVNVYRVLLPGIATPENISPPKTFHPEKKRTQGVKNPVKGGEKSGSQGVKPVSPKPSLNRHTEPSKEPSNAERAKRATRIPENFPMTEAMRDWLHENRPDLDPDLAHQEFCTYWRSEDRTKIDWLQTWQNGMLKSRMRRANAPLPFGRSAGRAQEKWDRTMATIMDFNPPERDAR